jgi:hypothetical protein
MYSPITLHRILKLNIPIRYFGNDTFVNALLEWAHRPPKKDIPLGRWCHPSSDKYKDNCKPDIKAHLANLDNSHQHSDNIDVLMHLELERKKNI